MSSSRDKTDQTCLFRLERLADVSTAAMVSHGTPVEPEAQWGSVRVTQVSVKAYCRHESNN